MALDMGLGLVTEGLKIGEVQVLINNKKNLDFLFQF